MRFCKDIETCYFEYFENAWLCPSIMLVSPCKKLWYPMCWNQLVENFDVYLHAKTKSTSSVTSFLRYYKDIANLIFWKLWECLTISMKNIVSISSKVFCLSACEKKSTSITYFFLKILQRNSKLFILGNLSMPGQNMSKMIASTWRSLWRLSAGKNQLYLSQFPLDIAKILWICYFGYFGHIWLCTTKTILSTCRKILCLSAGKQLTSFSLFF